MVPAAAGAAEIVVDGTTCTLAQAIQAANTDLAVGGCGAGSGNDLIQLDADAVLTTAVDPAAVGAPSGLPAVTTAVTIQARGASTIARQAALGCVRSDPQPFRLLRVGVGGSLELRGVTLQGGCVAPLDPLQTAAGGAVLVEAGVLMLADVSVVQNSVLSPAPAVGNPGVAFGGGVAAFGGTVRVAGSTFSDNRAIGHEARGGGLYAAGATIESIVGSEFANNQAGPLADWTASQAVLAAGGAIALESSNAIALGQLLLENNLAGSPLGVSRGGPARGGAIDVAGGQVSLIRDSLFRGNVARAGSFSSLAGTAATGGALQAGGRLGALVRSTFADNQALGFGTGVGRGGGVDVAGEVGTIDAVTWSGNVAQGGTGMMLSGGAARGGAIDVHGVVGRLHSSTMAGNSAVVTVPTVESRGGGIGVEADSGPARIETVSNTIVASNLADVGSDCWSEGTLVSGGFNAIGTAEVSCDFSGAGDVAGLDPDPDPLSDTGCSLTLPGGGCVEVMTLPAASSALDQGRCGDLLVDARGALRPFDDLGVANASGGDGCDVGAFEDGATPAVVRVDVRASDSVDPVISGSGTGNLVYRVLATGIGSAAANNVVVSITVVAPSGVTTESVTPSSGTWDGSNWSVASLASGEDAWIDLVLTVAAGTAGGEDVISVTALVQSADGHQGGTATVTEATSVLQPIFLDGFESGDGTQWSACTPSC